MLIYFSYNKITFVLLKCLILGRAIYSPSSFVTSCFPDPIVRWQFNCQIKTSPRLSTANKDTTADHNNRTQYSLFLQSYSGSFTDFSPNLNDTFLFPQTLALLFSTSSFSCSILYHCQAHWSNDQLSPGIWKHTLQCNDGYNFSYQEILLPQALLNYISKVSS